jgi:electron transfer flavoprotein alpha subunit
VPGEQGIFIIAEQSGGQLHDASLEVVSCGRQLADKLGAQVCAVVTGSTSQELVKPLGDAGADKVYFLENALLDEYSAELYVDALSKFIVENSPAIVLCSATLIGRDLAPRLAARLKTGLVSECIGLTVDEGGLLLATKLTYGGRASSTIVCPAARPQMATVKPGAITVSRPRPGRQAAVTMIKPEITRQETRITVKSMVKVAPAQISLDEADVIVAGGRGVGSRENFGLLEELAKRLGGVVAGSLGAIDEEWLPRKKLVGQTGTTVAPDLYIACGISGSIYHVLGMRDSGFVIAINKDRQAPIFKVADISIIGDVNEVLSAVLTRIDEGKQS